MKDYLDKLVIKYETADFIKDDPVQFVHIFKDDIKNTELMGFIASIFAYGQRKAFIQKLNFILSLTNHNPYEFIASFDKNESKLNGLVYRFYKDSDIKALFYSISQLIKKGMSIGDIFYESKSQNPYKIIEGVRNILFKEQNSALDFMIPNPAKMGANKRMNMFLRWMTRKPPVDIGIWDFIDTKNLIIPLDVHAGNTARKLNLLKRNQNDMKAAIELTEKLKEFDDKDPVKYDFALFGAGVNKENSQVLYLR